MGRTLAVAVILLATPLVGGCGSDLKGADPIGLDEEDSCEQFLDATIDAQNLGLASMSRAGDPVNPVTRSRHVISFCTNNPEKTLGDAVEATVGPIGPDGLANSSTESSEASSLSSSLTSIPFECPTLDAVQSVAPVELRPYGKSKVACGFQEPRFAGLSEDERPEGTGFGLRISFDTSNGIYDSADIDAVQEQNEAGGGTCERGSLESGIPTMDCAIVLLPTEHDFESYFAEAFLERDGESMVDVAVVGDAPSGWSPQEVAAVRDDLITHLGGS